MTDLTSILLVHICVVGGLLAVVFEQLRKKDLFHVRSAGFWAWLGLLIYLVLPPSVSLVQGDTSDYEISLGIAGGSGRALWVTLVSAVGIAAYFFVYFRIRTSIGRVASPSREVHSVSRPQVVVLTAAISVGLWSLITYRSGLVGQTGVVIVNGRDVGPTTGYQYTAHIFLFVPVALFLLHPDRLLRKVGYALGTIYVVIGSLDPNARFLQVSMVLLVGIAIVSRTDTKRWPNPFLLVAALILALFLGVRGHTTLTSLNDVLLVLQQIPAQFASQLSGANTNLLGNWYLQSFVDDTLVGFNYGLRLLNYLIAGYLPTRFVADKYFLIDWLHTQQPVITNPILLNRMNGAASGLLASFYSAGGIVGVALFGSVWGFVSRKIEGLSAPGNSLIIRALGVTWLSLLWMVWGRDDYWAADYLFTAAVPAMALLLVSPRWRRFERPHRKASGRSQRLQPLHEENACP